jgi:hypothetical protein
LTNLRGQRVSVHLKCSSGTPSPRCPLVTECVERVDQLLSFPPHPALRLLSKVTHSGGGFCLARSVRLRRALRRGLSELSTMFSETDRFVCDSLLFLNSQRIAAIPAVLLPAALPPSSVRCSALGLERVHAHAVATPQARPRACPRHLSLPKAGGLGTLFFALRSRFPHPSQDRCPRLPGNPRNSRGLLLAYRSNACTLAVLRPSALRKPDETPSAIAT